MTEAQHRFLKEIAARVTTGRVVEVRLFPTMRTGPLDSGVAVVAVEELLSTDPQVEVPVESGEGHAARARGADEAVDRDSVVAKGPDAPEVPARYSILTARFRHTVKGADRGKWEFDIVHDADAPLETVDSVVAGVARRAGEYGDPELLTPESFQHAVTGTWWTIPA